MRSTPFRAKSGRRASSLLLALAFAVGGCNYGFEGGGFPSHIRTIYIAPFENETPQFELDQKLFNRLLEELPRHLGVRPAGEGNADAVLRGRIVRYDDVAQNYQSGTGGTSNVFAHEVQIGISAELIDVRQNVIRWESRNLIGRGTYRPDNQSDDVAQQSAITSLIEQIIDGTQSQW